MYQAQNSHQILRKLEEIYSMCRITIHWIHVNEKRSSRIAKTFNPSGQLRVTFFKKTPEILNYY